MEETSNPTSPEAGRAVLGPVIWQEVLRLVIAPKLAVLVTRHGMDIENRQQLHRIFCEEYGIKPSYSTFSGWCEDLGITFRKRIEVTIPGWKEMPRPSPEFVGPMPAQPGVSSFRTPIAFAEMPGPSIQQESSVDEPFNWDTPQAPAAPTSDGLNIPEVLPGGMRPPAFLGGNEYAN